MPKDQRSADHPQVDQGADGLQHVEDEWTRVVRGSMRPPKPGSAMRCQWTIRSRNAPVTDAALRAAGITDPEVQRQPQGAKSLSHVVSFL